MERRRRSIEVDRTTRRDRNGRPVNQIIPAFPLPKHAVIDRRDRETAGPRRTVRKQTNAQSCQKELNAYFLNVHIDPVKDAPQAIQKQTSKQLVFKGNMRKDLEDWLTQKGF